MISFVPLISVTICGHCGRWLHHKMALEMKDYSDKEQWMQRSPFGSQKQLQSQKREKQLPPTDIYIGHRKRKINTAKIERLILRVIKWALAAPGILFIFLAIKQPWGRDIWETSTDMCQNERVKSLIVVRWIIEKWHETYFYYLLW